MSFSRFAIAAIFAALGAGCTRDTSSDPNSAASIDATPIAIPTQIAQSPPSSVPEITDFPESDSLETPDVESSEPTPDLESSEPTPALARIAPVMPPRETPSDLPLRWPAPPVKPVMRDARIADLRSKIARYGLFAAYRQLAEIYLSAGDYQNAARVLRDEAAQYRRKGMNDAAIIDEARASRYDTEIRLFIERAATSQEVDALYSRAPNEPFIGCYIGAFIDRDDNLRQSYQDENWQTHRTAREWAQAVGKPHASHFMYLRYGQPFPTRWVAELKAAGAIPHIAWEPPSLGVVRDDRYLNNFALSCRRADWPIFIRFASEMNGKWTPYHGNPKLYREKFALVHRVLHRHAPRIATIWCVNNPPLGNANDYYPGDNGCDWVGVNFYSVPFYQNNRKRPAFLDSPLALLDPIYKRYAARKPIAICEFAASHRPAMDNKLRTEFAIEKMALLYGALPRLYPRVKLINWFNMNTIAHPAPGKTLNDYTLTDQRVVMDAYRRVIAAPYFLGTLQRLGDTLPPLPRPLGTNTIWRGANRFSVWTNFQLSGRKVIVAVGSRVIYAATRPGAHEILLDTSRLPTGGAQLTVAVYDAQNRLANISRTTIIVAR